MLDVLISNAAYTAREEQRTGSAVSKTLHPSSAPFQAYCRNLRRESHKKVYQTLAQDRSFQQPSLWLCSHLHRLIHQLWNGSLALPEVACSAGKAAPARDPQFKLNQAEIILRSLLSAYSKSSYQLRTSLLKYPWRALKTTLWMKWLIILSPPHLLLCSLKVISI